MNPLARYFRSRLHRRIFAWFGAAILVTTVVVFLAFRVIDSGDAEPWAKKIDRVQVFVGGRFSAVWDDPVKRDELAASIARDLDVDVTIEDRERNVLATFGPLCVRTPMTTAVHRDGRRVGTVKVCVDRHHGHGALRALLPLVLALTVLWGASHAIARRISRPLVELARVAEDIGAGRLSSRARLPRRRHPDEMRLLAEVINDMASRIERQIADQRALLAAVSHEIRTPLARIRLLVEMARDAHGSDVSFDKLDLEVTDIDHLVSDLLASSRIDFSALAPVKLSAEQVALDALERAQVDPSCLVVETKGLTFTGDPTLVARALANLVANAKTHGGGVSTLRVRANPGAVVFEVEDDGGGFADGEELRIFEPFYKRARHAKASGEPSSVGLGLTLVRRIAEAHGGKAYARNRAPSGGLVAIELATGASVAS